MTARAHVQPDLVFNDLAIYLIDDLGTHRVVHQFEVNEQSIEQDESVEITARPLRIREDQARALYEALARHFGGSPDIITLQQNLTREQNRVDKFIDVSVARLGRE